MTYYYYQKVIIKKNLIKNQKLMINSNQRENKDHLGNKNSRKHQSRELGLLKALNVYISFFSFSLIG